MSVPFKSENQELNRLMDWMDNELNKLRNEIDKVVLKPIGSLSNIAPSDMNEGELRYRVIADGTKELLLRKDNKLHSETLTEES